MHGSFTHAGRGPTCENSDICYVNKRIKPICKSEQCKQSEISNNVQASPGLHIKYSHTSVADYFRGLYHVPLANGVQYILTPLYILTQGLTALMTVLWPICVY